MITLSPTSVVTDKPVWIKWAGDDQAGRFVLASSHWSQAVVVDQVATCQIYNHMDLRTEQHPVVVNKVFGINGGWELDCHVSIPFVGRVIQFVLRMHVDETTGRLSLTLPADGLEQLQPDAATLLSIDVLPGFAAASAGQSGYLFLPCFSGVLHRFDHDVSREQRMALYAEQFQWASKSHFNLIGMQTDGYAWCSIVTQGDVDSQMVVRSHYESARQYSVHTSWVYRWDATDPLIDGDRQVVLHLLPPAQQNFNRFAQIYRQWMRQERGLLTLEQKAQTRPAMSAFANSFLLKIMMGYKKADLNGQGGYQSSTTFAQARKIFEQLRADGIEHITTQLVGWNAQGHDGCYPQRFPVSEEAGGEQAMQDLIQWGDAHNVHIGVHDNYSDSYQCGDDFGFDNLIVCRDGRYWRNVPWAGGFNWRMCPKQSLKFAHRDMPRIAGLGVRANYYMDAIGAFATCHSSEHPADRRAIVEAFRELFRYAGQQFDTISTEVAFGPYLDLMDGVYMTHSVENACKFTDFVEHFVDEHVPALAVVLHNGIRYHLSHALSLQGRRGALMDCIWSAMPFTEIAYEHVPGAHGMPTYADVRAYVQASWELCCGRFADRVSVDLDAIEQVTPDIWLTRYADGKVLQTDLVNSTIDEV